MARLEDLDSTLVGERLRVARMNAGINQDIAAKVLDVSRPTLIAIEKGQRKIKLDEIDRLAQCYGIPLNRLLARDALVLDLRGRFRRVGIDESNALEAITQLNKLASASYELEQLLGLKYSQAYLPEKSISPGSVDRQAEEAALELRHRLGIGLAPISDIVSLFENELGVRIFLRPLPSEIAGLFAFDPIVGACILVNSKHPWERRALTVAHEIGHFLTNRNDVDLVELDEALSSQDERFAKSFSYSFLMPPAALRRKFQDIVEANKKFTPRHLTLLAHAFHVSIEALCRSLEQLELLPRGSFDSLKRRGFDKELVRGVLGDLAPQNASLPSNTRLAHLATSAYRRGFVSEGQLVSMLGMDRIEIRALMDQFGDSDEEEIGIDLA